MNRGTKEGEKYEKDFCIRFNKRDINLNINILKNTYLEDLYAVQVKHHKFSLITEKNVKPKSDAFLVNLTKYEFDQCKSEGFYLNEDSLERLKIKYLPRSGISIKNLNSKRYQFHKFTYDSFVRTFNNKFLFIGHLIYEKKHLIHKNDDIFMNLKVSKKTFFENFNSVYEEHDSEDIRYEKIKTFCKNEICLKINNSKTIQNIIFSGEGVFEDPFYASYFFQNDTLMLMTTPANFCVTTGSGRTKGIYTIVIKP